jgi:hypothetical protein
MRFGRMRVGSDATGHNRWHESQPPNFDIVQCPYPAGKKMDFPVEMRPTLPTIVGILLIAVGELED